MWTHLSDATSSKTQIDFILVDKKWQNCVKDTEVYSFFSSLGSDHRLIASKVRLSLQKTKMQPSCILYNWDILKTDYLQKDKYAINVKNQYILLCEQDEEDDATVKYDHFINAIEKTNEELIPKKKKKKPLKNFATDHVSTAQEQLQLAMKNHYSEPTVESSDKVNAKKTRSQISLFDHSREIPDRNVQKS